MSEAVQVQSAPRFFHVAHLIDTLGIGGAQRLLLTYAGVAKGRGVPVTVISMRDDSSGSVGRELAALGARVIARPGRGLLDPARVARVAGDLRREGVSVLHAHLTYAAVIGAAAGGWAGVPMAVSLHTSGRDPRHHHAARRALEALALRFGAARVIAVGRQVAEAHRARLGGRLIDVIPNAIPIRPGLTDDERRAARAEFGVGVAETLCVSVGRLAPPKGYPDLLAAFAELRRTHPEAGLIIAGEGDLRGELEAQIAREGLTGTVRLLGSRDDVPRLLAAADVFVSASHWEGMPVALLEAMAAGLPVIATRVGDVPAAVGERAGLLVRPRDPSSLAEAMRRLMDAPEARTRMGAAGRDRVRAQHDPGAWFEVHHRLYAAIVQSRSGIGPAR